MKKLISRVVVLAFLFVGAVNAFAQYKGDTQVVIGQDRRTIKLDGLLSTVNGEWKANSFNVGLKSFNTFYITKAFGVGFLASCDLAYGKDMDGQNIASPDDLFETLLGVDGFLGPAVSFNIKDLLVIQGAAGFDWQYTALLGEITLNKALGLTEDFNVYAKGLGWGWDVQAKLFPSAPVSLVGGAKGFFCKDTEYKLETDDTHTIKKDMNISSIKLYAGAAFNF